MEKARVGGSRPAFMAELKFSCPHCGQHIECGEPWSGRQIQCPACQNHLIVPHLPAPPAAAPALSAPVSAPPAPGRTKLAAGAAQAARPAPPGTAPRRQPPPPPRTGNPVLKFAIIAVLLAVIGGVGYIYGPGLLGRVQEMGTSKTPVPANASAGGSGPLGEVNGAMDVSDTLDGGAPSRPPPVAARQAVAANPPGSPATNSPAKRAHRRPH